LTKWIADKGGGMEFAPCPIGTVGSMIFGYLVDGFLEGTY
jgi:hypothetical protein